ncbi:CubicO group peptidase (beta-lactamase class C family) [Pontibacter aydingkolensis]|uniref:Beta-lactamase family protein n=1 Tax=Pontibacter aydingkolensis TaxID=1911536 RepID=A0ABS7CZF8_9BACT|nr:serine hydrolase [Pontibacter aydingkolensis]MBW7469244.1 beta-lactamase family protein [Pontibacter aydingkolensis]
MEDYTGGWEGKIPYPKAFSFDLTADIPNSGKAVFSISNNQTILSHSFNYQAKKALLIELGKNLYFEGTIKKDRSEINGFIKSGMLFYHIKLKRSEKNRYVGKWNILMVESLKASDLYLSIENGSVDEYQAYPVWGDNRFTGTWCADFQKEKNIISFKDFKTGLLFEGKLTPSGIILDIKLGHGTVTRVPLVRSETAWKIGSLSSKDEGRATVPVALKDGWKIGNANSKSLDKRLLQEMIDGVKEGALPNTHSVLIAQKGKLVFEKYFYGYDAAVPHDMRSASKSISSAIVGAAIDSGFLNSTDQSMCNLIPSTYECANDSLKSEISIHHLLTMSSGLDAIDFGINRKSVASEDNYQQSQDWAKTVLEAPMIGKPGSRANYGSANPYLLGLIIDGAVPNSLELFMDEQLLQPLGISNYIIQADMAGKPYFGGGMYLTPRDMLKFGQLYLNSGNWKGKKVLSRNWVNQSFSNHITLENTENKNGYGYLWWHQEYQVKGHKIESIEARGAGGQYIFVLPRLDAVVVITSGNYRNGKTQQPEYILKTYILPSILKD